MKKILIVDDLESKVAVLRELFKEIDPSGKDYELVLPIKPRDAEVVTDDRKTVMSFLDCNNIHTFHMIFQDKNLGNVTGAELLAEYTKRGYKGPVILFTSSEWSWYSKCAKYDIMVGFKDVFPWNASRVEQLALIRKYW